VFSLTFLQQLPTKISQIKSRRKVGGDTWAEKGTWNQRQGILVRAKNGC